MKLLITGASGFLGRYVVSQALKRDHKVRAVVRSSTQKTVLTQYNHPKLELCYQDLQFPQGMSEKLKDIDAVIHLAACLKGNYKEQYQGTVINTQNLLTSMLDVNLRRLIAISTFSVYDYLAIDQGEALTETSPLENHPKNRGNYAQTKLLQEKLIRQFAQDGHGQVTFLRPGMVYGRENLWHPFLGINFHEKLLIRIDRSTPMPLIYVENCAEAILWATENPATIGQTLNLVDDDLPTPEQYFQALLNQTHSPPYHVVLDWNQIQGIARLAQKLDQICLELLPLPRLLRKPAILAARFKPLYYSNDYAKNLLSWIPRYSFSEAIVRSCGEENLLTS